MEIGCWTLEGWVDGWREACSREIGRLTERELRDEGGGDRYRVMLCADEAVLEETSRTRRLVPKGALRDESCQSEPGPPEKHDWDSPGKE